MNTYIALCLMGVLGLSQGNPIGGYGYGSPWYYPAAVSTANMVKAAPITVVRSHVVPVVSAPLISSVGYGYGLGYGGLGYGGHGYGGHGVWGGHGAWGGLGGWGGSGLWRGALGWGNYGGWGGHHG